MKAVFVLKVRGGHLDEFVERWTASSELFQRCPGAQGTKLHRSLTDDHLLCLYASWDSKASRDAAVQSISSEPGFDSHIELAQLVFAHEFDDPSVEINWFPGQ